MKVFDLQCAHGHGFEGWFASEDDYRQQTERGFLTCPVCGEAEVRKMLSAPRLNLQKGAPSQPSESVPMAHTGNQKDLHARLLQVMREVVANTEDVGERFAEEARAMHHGEVEQRSIRGQASPQEAMELIEEGIEVVPLPSVPAAKETLP